MGAADDLRADVADALAGFRAALADADLDATTSSGWTAKEMTSHVAFWMETVAPFVTGAFRGEEGAFDHVFASGYRAGDGDWPEADVHNAREAAWAREQSADAVRDRFDAAAATMTDFLDSVTDDEATTQAAYFADIAGHLRDHVREIAT